MEMLNACKEKSELIIMWDLNADENRGKFLRISKTFKYVIFAIIFVASNLATVSLTYRSSNTQSSTIWLDHMTFSNDDFVHSFEFVYFLSLNSCKPMYLEIFLPSVGIIPEVIMTPLCRVHVSTL